MRARKIKNLSASEIKAEIRKNVSPNARIVTDQYRGYLGLDKEFQHETVDHGSREYVRGDIHTNTLEG